MLLTWMIARSAKLEGMSGSRGDGDAAEMGWRRELVARRKDRTENCMMG